MTPNAIIHGDCLEVMRGWPDGCVDLVFGSPPYADARTYGIDFALKGQAWVDWMVERVVESLRVCRGLVAFVIEGRTKQFRWTAEPALLLADLHRRGVHLRKPPIYKRVGIPGSGGPDWLRNDYEFIVCATRGGKLAWSDNTAMGKAPKYETGGACSNRRADGRRINAAVGSRLVRARRSHTKREPNREMREQHYAKPKIANPGNVIKCKVGGGRLGSPLAHENEAPFPEQLAEFFIRSFCPPEGVVLDPFCGSGTTASVAVRTGRKYVTIDIRESQCELAARRLATVQRELI
jgi:site-specific DNA-methyltransferase (adenine-specific)